MSEESDPCYGCGAVNGLYLVDLVLPNGEVLESPRSWIYPQTSRGEIVFCNNRFETRNFRDLTPDDIQTITWFFATSYVEDQPHRTVELLEPFLAKWRVPDILSPLGRAYIATG